MSSRHLLVLMALTSILVVPGAAAQGVTGNSLADLLLRDEIEALEARLAQSPKTAEAVAFSGEIQYRNGHFEKARELYETALRMDRRTARANFGLGKLALAKLKIKDAQRHFSKAIELDPKEPLYRLYMSDAFMSDKKPGEAEKHLKEYVRLNPADPERLTAAKAGLEVMAAFKGIDAGAVEAPERVDPIPFQPVLNLIFAEVSVNGQGPFRFVIDTGATQTVLSEKLATQLGIKPITTTVMHGVGGEGKIDSLIYRVDSLQIGQVTVKDLPVGTFSDPMVMQLADGIIGTSMLSDFIITIDYPENQMELARKSSPGPGANAIPVWCMSNLLLMPVEVNGQHLGNFLIDTGAVTTVVSHGMAKNLGITEDSAGARLQVPMGGIGGRDGSVLMVPNVTLKTPTASEHLDAVVSINMRELSKMVQTEISGVVGYDFLRHYKLTLDYYKAEIRLTR